MGDKFGIAGVIALLLLYLAALGGWIANIVKLVYMFVENAPFTAMLVGRALGIPFAPVGALLGYF